MKRKAARLPAVLGLCALLLGGCGAPAGTSGAENLPVDYLLGDFAVDVYNPCELVGFSDYYFIAVVDEGTGTSYRHEVTLETEGGGKKTLSTPYTDYTVTVLRNVKGALPEDGPVPLTKAGGVARGGKSVVLYEDDLLLEPGKTYAITACVQEDGTLLVSGPNSCELVEDGVNMISSGLDEYESHYLNEVPYDRERYEYAQGV